MIVVRVGSKSRIKVRVVEVVQVANIPLRGVPRPVVPFMRGEDDFPAKGHHVD